MMYRLMPGRRPGEVQAYARKEITAKGKELKTSQASARVEATEDWRCTGQDQKEGDSQM